MTPEKKLFDKVDETAALLSVLGNGKRLAIMLHLVDRELSVGQIAQRIGLSQSALSQHLAKLRSMNLVATRRDRQMIYYSCTSDEVRNLLRALGAIYDRAA